MSTLTIVNNNGEHEVHSVRIDDGHISVLSIEDGSTIKMAEMESLFPGFKEIIKSADSTLSLLENLQSLRGDYIWAHVSGKL